MPVAAARALPIAVPCQCERLDGAAVGRKMYSKRHTMLLMKNPLDWSRLMGISAMDDSNHLLPSKYRVR